MTEKHQFKIKTKEVQPKLYCILFVNKAAQKQVIKLILAYTFEDAVGTGRIAIANLLGLTTQDAIAYEPTQYEAVKVDGLIDFLLEGGETVVSDANMVMKKVLDFETREEAEDALKRYSDLLPENSLSFLRDKIKSKPSKEGK